ncbi:MAG TPA: type II secretion system F family protein [Thermoleophilaceae bacterium]
MTLILLTGLILVGFAVALTTRALTYSRTDAARRLAEIQSYGFGAGAVEEAPPPASLGSALDHTAGRLGGWAARHLGSFREDDVRKQLTIAGIYSLTPITFLGYRVLCTALFPALFVWCSSALGLPALLAVIGTLASFAVGWVAPMTYVRRRARQRFDKIERDLPELIDLLVLTVEAGVGFSGALQLAAQRLRGPLGDELRLTLQEQSMGLATNAALANMLSRSDTPSMRSFVRSVIQGESLGVSIGQILRNLATEMRKRRRAHAEERAQKAPIKILFPLVFLIFPPMFAVLLYPALSTFSNTFG